MSFVIDASAVGALLLMDGRSALAATTEGLIAAEQMRAPVHWPVEIASLIVKAERSSRITADAAGEAWDAAAAILEAATIETRTRPGDVFRLARQHGLTAQDAAYLDLALMLGTPLLTGDKRLARVCTELSVPLPFDPKA